MRRVVRIGRQSQIQRHDCRFVSTQCRDGTVEVFGEDHFIVVKAPAHLLLQTAVVFDHEQGGAFFRHQAALDSALDEACSDEDLGVSERR